MNTEIKESLHGCLVRYGEEGPRDAFTKQNILDFSKGDIETADAALKGWASQGAVYILSDLRSAPMEALVVRINFPRLSSLLIGY